MIYGEGFLMKLPVIRLGDELIRINSPKHLAKKYVSTSELIVTQGPI